MLRVLLAVIAPPVILYWKVFATFLILSPEDKKVPTPATYKFVAVINPTVVIPVTFKSCIVASSRFISSIFKSPVILTSP